MQDNESMYISAGHPIGQMLKQRLRQGLSEIARTSVES
jgi:hypothetical protein